MTEHFPKDATEQMPNQVTIRPNFGQSTHVRWERPTASSIGDCEPRALDGTTSGLYGYHMPYGKEKTTVYLDSADHRRLKAMAAAESRPAAELIREAVAEYVRRRGSVSAASVGAGRSGRTDLSERTEELLEGFGA